MTQTETTAPIQTYRMIVRTELPSGKILRELIDHLTADEIPARREAARLSAPTGCTRTVNVKPSY